MPKTTLESALTDIEKEADATIRSLSASLAQAKKVKGAAALGQLRELRQALDNTVKLTDTAADATRALQLSWTFDAERYFASGGFTKEILALASDEGVSVFESDERILSYPAIVAISAADTTVVVDKKKDKRVRPTVLVSNLKALQSRPLKFKPEAFVESLAHAYDHVAAKKGKSGVMTLADVYNVLTLLPGSAREYSKQEFARDLYLLDQSGITKTRNGRKLSWQASALTRGTGNFVTVARSGQEKVYAGISFAGGGK